MMDLQLRSGTDKSMYSPKDIVKINFKIGNTTEKGKKNIPVIIRVMHLGEVVAEFPVSTISLAPGSQRKRNINGLLRIMILPDIFWRLALPIKMEHLLYQILLALMYHPHG